MTKREIVIEEGIPLPTKSVSRKPEYPFQSMEVGHSFFIAGGNQNTIHSAINRYRKSEKGLGKEFSLRTVHEVVKGQEDLGEQEGIRVWRTT